jgi:hypothetical protein
MTPSEIDFDHAPTETKTWTHHTSAGEVQMLVVDPIGTGCRLRVVNEHGTARFEATPAEWRELLDHIGWRARWADEKTKPRPQAFSAPDPGTSPRCVGCREFKVWARHDAETNATLCADCVAAIEAVRPA